MLGDLRMKNQSVYMINVFLEAGKSEFITFTIAQPYFKIKGKTLLLVCEEGEVEYDPELLKQTNTELVVIDSEEDFTTATLSGIERRVKPDRIIIEWNGMWNYKNCKLPWNWKIEHRRKYIPDVLHQYAFPSCRDDQKIRNDHLQQMRQCERRTSHPQKKYQGR